MYKVNLRKTNKIRRKLSIRKKISGDSEKPRLSVFRSNRYIYAQIIDDTKGSTLVSVMNEVQKLHKKGPKQDSAYEVGKLLAQKALDKKIKQVVFDRNGYRYHGRVKKLAEGAREGGLKL